MHLDRGASNHHAYRELTLMRCDWEEIEDVPAGTWRRVRCTRCGHVMAPTPHPFERIDRECRINRRLSWPWMRELGNWLWLCLEAHFITKTARCRGKCDARQKAANELGMQLLAPGERMG